MIRKKGNKQPRKRKDDVTGYAASLSLARKKMARRRCRRAQAKRSCAQRTHAAQKMQYIRQMMESIVDHVQDPSFLKGLGAFVISLVIAGQFDNHFWRLIFIGVNGIFQHCFFNSPWWIFPLQAYCIMYFPQLRSKQAKRGSVFITGADSGMVSSFVRRLGIKI